MSLIILTISSKLCPDYVGTELGIGESLLIKAIGESTGRSLATVKAELKKEGDLGLVAMVSTGCIYAHPIQLTYGTEFQEQPEDFVQTEAHDTFDSVQELEGDCSQQWSFRMGTAPFH